MQSYSSSIDMYDEVFRMDGGMSLRVGWVGGWMRGLMGGWMGLKISFINTNDMYNNDVCKGEHGVVKLIKGGAR